MHGKRHQLILRGKRATAAGLAATGLVAGLSGCGGGSGAASPKDPPSTSPTSSTPSAPETTPVAQQKQDVLAVPDRFFAAANRLHETLTVDPMAETATARFAAKLLDGYKTTIVDVGKTAIGGSKIVKDTAEIEIDGTTATVEVCVDNTRTFIVPKGTKTAGVGAVSGSRDIETFTLKLDNGAWKVDNITSDGKPC